MDGSRPPESVPQRAGSGLVRRTVGPSRNLGIGIGVPLRMEVFIGSSRESLGLVRHISAWLEESGHSPLPWNDPGLFAPGDYTFETLLGLRQRIGAAVLVFSEDDKTWYRGTDSVQPRDNVLIEYGLFAGVLGRHRAIICRSGSPRTATDLLGLMPIEMSPDRIRRGQAEFAQWASQLGRIQERNGVLFLATDERKAKLVGRWRGTFAQPEYPGGALNVSTVIEFTFRDDRIVGHARVAAHLTEMHRGGPREVNIDLDLVGEFRDANFLKIEYRSRDKGVNQFGSMILALNAEGIGLSGRFVGYGAISESVISGIVTLAKHQ